MTRFKITIEREDGAPIVAVISELRVTPMKPPRGRPKATAKHAAVVMAFGFEYMRLNKRRLKAREAVARQFGYRGDSAEHEVRRIIHGKQNLFLGAKGRFVRFQGSSGDLVVHADHPDAVVETETTIRVDGRCWIWSPGMTRQSTGGCEPGERVDDERRPARLWPSSGASRGGGKNT